MIDLTGFAYSVLFDRVTTQYLGDFVSMLFESNDKAVFFLYIEIRFCLKNYNYNNNIRIYKL